MYKLNGHEIVAKRVGGMKDCYCDECLICGGIGSMLDDECLGKNWDALEEDKNDFKK